MMVAEAEEPAGVSPRAERLAAVRRRQASPTAPSTGRVRRKTPVELAVASHALRGGAPARLNLRIETHAVCDPRVHPEVVHVGARVTWRGRAATRPGSALRSTRRRRRRRKPTPRRPESLRRAGRSTCRRVTIASCGLRDAGAPFGEVALRGAGLSSRAVADRGAPSGVAADGLAGDRPIRAAPTADLQAREGRRAGRRRAWQKSWRGLQAPFRAGMERLYNEWARVLDNAGAAARGRGLAAGRPGRLHLGLAPHLGLDGGDADRRRARPARALDRAAAVGRAGRRSGSGAHPDPLQGPERAAHDDRAARATRRQEGQDLKSVLRTWRFPFTLEIEPLAGAEPSTLSAAAGPMPITGALVGECGLRPRGDGGGVQWFFALRAEPVTIVSEVSDPLLGSARQTRKIFPALVAGRLDCRLSAREPLTWRWNDCSCSSWPPAAARSRSHLNGMPRRGARRRQAAAPAWRSTNTPWPDATS